MKCFKHVLFSWILLSLTQGLKAQCSFGVNANITQAKDNLGNLTPNRFDFSVNTASTIGPIKYKWKFGDGDTTTNVYSSIAYHHYETPGNYSAELIVTDGLGCSDTSYHQVSANDCDYGFKYEITQNGLDTRFDFRGSKFIKHFDFGDGDTLVKKWVNTTHTYSTPGLYSLTTVLEKGSCRDTIQDTIQVFSTQQCVVSQVLIDSFENKNNTFCIYYGFPSAITDDDYNYYYKTDTNTGFTRYTTSMAYNPTMAGIAACFTGETGVFETCIVRNAFTSPLSSGKGSISCGDWTCKTRDATGPFCKARAYFDGITRGDTAYFSGNNYTSSSVRYFWDFGNGDTSILQNPTYIYSSGIGTYNVKLIVTDTIGCSDTFSRTIKVCNSFTPNFLINQNQNQVKVKNITTGITWNGQRWDFEGHVPFNSSEWQKYGEDSVTHLFNNPGTYKITLSTGDNTCMDTTSKQVTITSGCFLAANIIDSVAGNTIYLSPFISWPNGTVNYIWDFGDGNQSNASNPIHTYGNPGTFQVSLIIWDSLFCRDTVTKTIIANGAFNCPISPSFIESITGLSVVYNSASTGIAGPATYNWDFGDGSFGLGISTNHTYTSQGIYLVKLTVSDTVCKDSTTRLIGVSPNVFTPNGDMIDDVFPLPCSGTAANVYNSTGVLVKTLASGTPSWDGTNNLGGNEPTGLYFVLCAGSSTPVPVTLIR